MLTASDYQIEAQLLGKRPRHLRSKHKMSLLNIFFIPFLLFAAALSASTWYAIAVSWFGEVVPGKVVARHILTGGQRPPYRIEYSYVANGRNLKSEASVNKERYNSLGVGEITKVRFLSLYPNWGVQLVSPYESLLNDTLSRLLWATICTFWFSTITWGIFIAPISRRFLIAKGLPTVGRIIESRTAVGQSTTLVLRYEYSTSAHSNISPMNVCQPKAHDQAPKGTFQGRTTVAKDSNKNIQIGDFVTVLFNPRRPRRSIIYKLADYEVV